MHRGTYTCMYVYTYMYTHILHSIHTWSDQIPRDSSLIGWLCRVLLPPTGQPHQFPEQQTGYNVYWWCTWSDHTTVRVHVMTMSNPKSYVCTYIYTQCHVYLSIVCLRSSYIIDACTTWVTAVSYGVCEVHIIYCVWVCMTCHWVREDMVLYWTSQLYHQPMTTIMYYRCTYLSNALQAILVATWNVSLRLPWHKTIKVT